ncbi:MAG TPA: cyclic nucleotide-binding domain-containing protein [Acidimicrobiales bacterium]|nr:cyclic nucleotide-binding domain-containing protein [Acidimicrobiales bacterium]
MRSREEVLAGVPLFSMLKPKELKRLAAEAHDMAYPAGKSLTQTDELGATFFVVAEGALEVSVGGTPVRTLGPGDYFGEMALIDHQARSATIVATTECRCLVFSGWVFRPFALEHPEVAWALLERMVARVREAESR